MRKILVFALAPLALLALAVPASAAPPDAPTLHDHVRRVEPRPERTGGGRRDGPISGVGTDVQVSGRSAGRTDHAVDLLTFAAGSITVKDMAVTGPENLDAATCTLHESDKGVFHITSGTGAYTSAKGNGHFTITINIQATVDPSSPGGCNFDDVTGTVVVNADAKVKL